MTRFNLRYFVFEIGHHKFVPSQQQYQQIVGQNMKTTRELTANHLLPQYEYKKPTMQRQKRITQNTSEKDFGSE